MQTVFPADPLN